MNTSKSMTLNTEIEIDENSVLLFRKGRTYYFHGALQASDVSPGPVHLSGVNLDWGSGKFYVFYAADCAFPPYFLVQHDSWENAYEEFIDWQVDLLKIEEPDLKDYEEDEGNYTCGFTSNGVPVDTESVQGHEVQLVAVIPRAGDTFLWNLATMALSQVTRYENEYDANGQMLGAIATCCNPERAKEAWQMARNLRHFAINP